jgi:hypothetical protein
VGAAERVVLTTIVAVTSVCALSAPSPASSPCPVASTLANGYTPVVTIHNTAAAEEMDAAGAADLYGNEVTDAVATFKLDDKGSLYEVHSPQTELPVLGSPTS